MTRNEKYTCIRGHEVRVLKSGAGYYIGTTDPEDSCPHCRVSRDYYGNQIVAQQALDDLSFRDTNSAENQFCNGGKGCRFARR